MDGCPDSARSRGRLPDTRRRDPGVCSGLMRPSPDASQATLIEHAPPVFPAVAPRPPGGALVGRERALARILDALEDPSARIVTLAGPGGSGKSRLAIEAARSPAPSVDGRGGWIHLASVSSVGQVESELACGVGMADVPPDRLPAELATTLGA